MNTLPPSLVRFESQLEGAIRHRHRRRPRRLVVRTALVGAVAGATALGVFSAMPGGGPSVVERATAALAPVDGTILHIVLDGSITGPDGTTSMRIETWQATTPPYDTREITTRGGQRTETGTANGAAVLYDPATDTVFVSPIDPKANAANAAAAAKGGATTPPPGRATDRYREKILGLLQSGTLHEDGHVTVDGRDAIRIVSGDGRVLLTVDAGTYQPIDWRVSEDGQTVVAHFPVYDQLAPSDASRALTSITAQHPGAKVDTDAADYDAAAHRLEPKKLGS